MSENKKLQTECFLFCLFITSLFFLYFLLLGSKSTNAQDADLALKPATTPSSSAQAQNDEDDLAKKAFSEELPHVSAAILRVQLQEEKDPLKHSMIALRLAEILLREGHPEESLSILNSLELTDLKKSSASSMILFWKAQDLLALKRPQEAALLLEENIDSHQLDETQTEISKIALARAYRAEGQFEQALQTLETLPQTLPENGSIASLALQEKGSILLALQRGKELEELFSSLPPERLKEQPRFSYLLALAAAQRGDSKEALRRFYQVGAKDPWASSASISGIIDSHLLLNKPAEAQLILEKYLQENPDSPRMAELISQLEKLYLLENNNATNLFQQWSDDRKHSLRASYALPAYARMLERLGHVDKANDKRILFLKDYPQHPLRDEVTLEIAQLKLLEGDPQSALSYLMDRADLSTKMRARYAFERGLAQSTLKNHDAAEKAFEEAALLDPELSEDALYNQRILQDFSSHQSDSLSPKKSNDPGVREREEYLSIFQIDEGTLQSAPAVIQAARHFLRNYPQSSLTNQVRMKLGEALLASGKVREARVELETVGKLESSSALGRAALFLAAQAASRSMDPKSIDDALMLLEQIAQNPHAGLDAWQARLEQASLKNAQALPEEAIAIYDQILSSQEATAQLKRTAQMAKGDTLNSLGPKDPTNYKEAMIAWRQLANDPTSSPYWRNQALCKIGLTNEKLGENDAALAAYYEALKTPLQQEPEIFWHDKAAFQAALLLESQKQWDEAIKLYEQIIQERGPRATEAKNRINKLRLENFLWEK